MARTTIANVAFHTATQPSTRDFAPFISACPLEQVYESVTPARTETHCPISHGVLLDAVKTSLEGSTYKVNREAHQLSHDDQRYFGVLELIPRYSNTPLLPDDNGGGSMLIGIRNSHDKSVSMGLVSGMQVTVCSNGLFNGLVNITSKHTSRLDRRINSLVLSAVSRCLGLGEQQQHQIAAYRERELTDVEANDLFVRAMRTDAICASKLPKVIDNYYTPPHPEFEERTLWSWVNAITQVYKEMSASSVTRRSIRLHALADAYSGVTLGA